MANAALLEEALPSISGGANASSVAIDDP